MTTAKGVSFQRYNNGWTNTWTTLLDLVYPVGSVYLSRKTLGSFDPGNYFGGNWSKADYSACLRTSATYSLGVLPNSKQGSDTHFHSVTGPEKYQNSSIGVRTSICFGGYEKDSTDNVLWARWHPAYQGSEAKHPGLDEYMAENGFSYVTPKTNPSLIFYTGSIIDTQGVTQNVAGCYGWTRGNSTYVDAGIDEGTGKAWTQTGNGSLSGDGTVPVAYTLVAMWERTS